MIEFRVGQQTGTLRLDDVEVSTRDFGLWADLSISSPDGRVVIRGVRVPVANRFAQWVRLRQSAAALRGVQAEFDAMMNGGGYLNRARVVRWASTAHAVLDPLRELVSSGAPDAMAEECATLDEVRVAYDELESKVVARNEVFVADQAREFRMLFDTVERQPLTDRQVTAILHDEDHALVVAGAGTGKTSTVVGKIAFLLRSGAVQPREILALAYNRKAATEMVERVKSSLNERVEVQTFHALGYRIVASVRQQKPSISDYASDTAGLSRWIATQLDEMLQEPALRSSYLRITIYDRDAVKRDADFRTREEYESYLREEKPRTLTGILVKSAEERLLADWLTLHGVRYEYERPYEHPTATADARQYKPDFFLPDFGVYVEHLGVDRSGATAKFVDRKQYHEGIAWKRELHKRYGTKLIETYSYERMEGDYDEVWTEKFRKEEVTIQSVSAAKLSDLLDKSVRSTVSDLLCTSLVVARESSLDEVSLRSSAARRKDARRCLAFLDLYAEIHQRYTTHLSDREEIDFADMVTLATAFVERGQYVPPFKRIIVDEFQDLSPGRLRLLLALLRAKPDVRLFCVGDDGQSIYGFTGSDVGVMYRFDETFGFSKRTDLDITFRCNDKLLTATTRFVQENPAQLRKDLRSRMSRATPAITIVYHPTNGLDYALRAIEKDEAFRGTATVLVLGRYHDTFSRHQKTVASTFTKLEVSFTTVHQAKGLEADYVVVLDVADREKGFPARIATDPVMTLVLPESDEGPYAEERRLFYVALTRARHRAFVCTPPDAKSVFVSELLKPEYHGLVDGIGRPFRTGGSDWRGRRDR